MKNQLLSIAFIDVQGYTKRTASQSREDNERFVKEIHEFVAQNLEKYEGKLVKTMGDGFMASFASPTNAIQCGLDMQRKLESRNANVVDPNHYIRFRIGINTGEVGVDERGDLFGDTVNIAARIESFAESNEVFISEATYLAMNRNEFGTIDLGLQNFKNATREIRVYKISKSGIPPGTTFKSNSPAYKQVEASASFFRRWSVGVFIAISMLFISLGVLAKVWIQSKDRVEQGPPGEARLMNPLFQLKIEHIGELISQNRINVALNEAEELWKSVKKDESKIHPMYFVGFGSLYLRCGQKDKADDCFSRALKITQNNPTEKDLISRRIAEVIRGKVFFGHGETRSGAPDITGKPPQISRANS
ncbi:MAG: adenylate/guanylate cyclase domain-containing protein [Candidatus Riflebacteria bacterium]|nr:adenylate/guanylate cyclase domain-containing protein [Candidatus Riflebacteria bacterium]